MPESGGERKMTNITRKGIWFIVLGTFALAVVIFLAWATSGFTNWNAESWFDYWGKGKPVKTVIVDKDKESKAMVMVSADVDHEVVTDSPDASTTFAVTALATPSLFIDYSTDTLKITVYSTVVGTVNVYGCPHNREDKQTIWFTFLEQDFVIGTNSASYSFPLSDLRSKISSLADSYGYLMNSVTGTNTIALFAKHVNKSGYVDSGLSTGLYISDIPEIQSEFTDTIYKVSCLETYYNAGKYSLRIYKSASYTQGATLELKDQSFVTYRNGNLEVDLLAMSNELNKLEHLDVYYMYFAYTSFTVGDRPSYTFSNYSRCNYLFSTFSVTYLPAPANLKYESGTITWDPVEGATEYGVFWTQGGVEQKAFVSTTSYTFDINALGEGEYTVRVRALGNLGQTAKEKGQTAQINAFNASSVVQQVVALTYKIEDDTVIKFVPYGSNVKDYLYDVEIKGREFGGWYYDSGFSRKVESTDVLGGDTTVYARLSEKKVTERQLTWWEQHKWQVLIPLFVAGGLVILGAVVAVIRKKKA